MTDNTVLVVGTAETARCVAPLRQPVSRRFRQTWAAALMKYGCAIIVTAALGGAMVGFASPVWAAPAGPGDAEQTISQLRAQGYHVVVNRVGSTPLDKATVVAVRPGQTYSRTDSGVPGTDNSMVTTVTGRTVYVDVQ